MDSKRLSEPSFIASALSCVLLFFLLATRTSGPSPSKDTSQPVTSPDLQAAIKGLENQIGTLEVKLDALVQTLDQPSDAAGGTLEQGVELHTKQDAEKVIADLGNSPTAERLAEALATVDGWVADPGEADALQEFKASQVTALRKLVKNDVDHLHEQALKADTGKKAAELYTKASQILAIYPTDSSESVLDEARSLSSKHSEVGVRINVIRRQRYNAWAMTRIEEAIKAINSIASSIITSDNPKTIDATVKQLGEIDPLLLEPVVVQLYNYAIDQAKINVTRSNN